MSDGVRLDALLVMRGLISGREKAKELIENGAVLVNGKVMRKASLKVDAECELQCDTSSVRFVGRGGFKLEKALQISELDVSGKIAMDVGASTGGFTDCLLQSGAEKVYAIDVGTGQLHPSLCADARVINMEGTDIRSNVLHDNIPSRSVDVCAIDVSFISLQQVLPSVLPYLRNGATILCLIKPQFEAGRSAVGKHGVVKDKKAHCAVLEAFCAFVFSLGLQVKCLDFSPVTGGEGNIEFLSVLVYTDTSAMCVLPAPIREVVESAHKTLKKGGKER